MNKKQWTKLVDNDYEALVSNADTFDNFVALLGRGHFPRELPPPFSTKTLADAVVAEPDIFKSTISSKVYERKVAQICKYSLARPGQLRRNLGIPNPAFHFLLSLKLARLYKDFHYQYITEPQYSVSFPVRQDDERLGAFAPSMDWNEIPLRRLKDRTKGKYLVTADIARFYPSIYTHSIPWAMHGKEKAKEKKTDYSLAGNFLDRLIRGAQDGQTLGIPIGPDTSFIVAEKLLLEVDKYIHEKIGANRTAFFHRVDDYEFVCIDRKEADYIVSILQEALQVYELELNTLKTTITELPQHVQDPDVAQLRSFEFGFKPSRTKLLEYYDLAFECHKRHPSGSLKYAIKRIPAECFDETIADFMVQSMLLEPGVIEAVFKWLVQAERLEEIDKKNVVHCLSHIICEHSVLGHSSEVAWAIWGHLLLKERIPTAAASAIVKMNDAVVLLLALDAQEKGLLRNGNLQKKVAKFMTEDQLYGPHWLLAYEAVVKKWTSSKRRRHVETDTVFRTLKNYNVSFYESDDIDSYKERMKTWEPYSIYVPTFEEEKNQMDIDPGDEDDWPF